MPRLVFEGAFDTGGCAAATADEDGSIPSIGVALFSNAIFAFLAEARLGGGGEIPRLSFFD